MKRQAKDARGVGGSPSLLHMWRGHVLASVPIVFRQLPLLHQKKWALSAPQESHGTSPSNSQTACVQQWRPEPQVHCCRWPGDGAPAGLARTPATFSSFPALPSIRVVGAKLFTSCFSLVITLCIEPFHSQPVLFQTLSWPPLTQ